MSASPLHQLHAAGQSIWLDFINRDMLDDGELARRIAEDDLTGMTSNPSIFEKALAEGTSYDSQLGELGADVSAAEAFEILSTDDVRRACDLFRPVHDATGGKDGFVSLEVSPGMAHDTEGTISEAHRLWARVDRPNVMIKVPGTVEGTEAIRRLTADGVNVNITLLFAIDAHRQVIDAYMSGLEERAAAGKPLDHIASVASFFVSRVDTKVDRQLEAIVAAGGEKQELARSLLGQVAIANAKLAYRLFTSSFAGARWEALSARGAQLQRPLWASTSTKNPAYSDVLYIEQLIGPHTVNTIPPATIEAFRDHGKVARTIDQDVDGAVRTLAQLESLGVSLDSVTDELLKEGVASFAKSFATLLTGLDRKRQTVLAHR